MCFDAKTSIITFFITVITSSILIMCKNVQLKTIGIFFIHIAIVQLLEFFMWKDQTCTMSVNNISTSIIPYFVYLQPVIIYIIAVLYNPKIYNKWLTIANILYSVYVIYTILTIDSDKCTTPDEDGHLGWNSKYSILGYVYLIFLFINIFGSFSRKYSIPLAVAVFISFALSRHIFKYRTGEMWCFFAAFLPIVILIYASLVPSIKCGAKN